MLLSEDLLAISSSFNVPARILPRPANAVPRPDGFSLLNHQVFEPLCEATKFGCASNCGQSDESPASNDGLCLLRAGNDILIHRSNIGLAGTVPIAG